MRLILCGDICPTASTEAAFEAADLPALLGTAAQRIAQGDFSIANLECALTDTNNPIRKKGPNLKGKPEWAKVLAQAGFTHMGLSNNHVMDFGIQGLRDTARAVEDAKMIWFGIGENDQDSRKPVYLEKDGVRVAIVAVCEHEYSYALPDQMGANPFDPFDTMEDITLAKEQADHVIVMYHGGKEQCRYPSPRLRKACRAMVRAGASLVLCQHSHCIGCCEDYRGGHIVYGMGNFLFAKYIDHPHWHSGSMLDVQLTREDYAVEFVPVVVTDTGITLAQGEEKEQLIREYRQRSVLLQDDEAWMKEWNAFCQTMPYYHTAIENIRKDEDGKEQFAHYLDCEAHTDVWRTLYPTWHANKTTGA